MKLAHRFCLFLVIGVSAAAFAGDIQVSCSPGLRVYLDDRLMGTSNAMQDGLFLMDVRKGSHVIRIEKDGFLPRTIQVEVSDFPIEVRVGELVPDPGAHVRKEATAAPIREEVGYLVITSAPQNCTVEIDGRAEIKETPQISIDRLAAGEHTLSFSKPGYETISGVVNIPPGTEVTVRGNLFDGKIETVHEGRGALRIHSTPKSCTVYFRGERHDKIHLALNLTRIPAGEYPIVVEIPGRRLSTTVLIRDEMRTVLEVSFIKGDEPFTVSYVPY
jgi:hypothetical protein